MKKGTGFPGGAFLCAAAVLALAGCGKAESGEETAQKGAEPENQSAVLRIFDKNERHAFEDDIAREIMKRTGVEIQVLDATDNPQEQIDLMLAYQNYPDIILVGLEDIWKYRDSGCLVDISGYVEREGGNIREMYADMLNLLREPDGKLYYLSNWYGEDRDAVSAFQIRYDYLVSLVGKERADSDEPFTQEEFLGLLRQFQETYPEINGQESIPFTVNLKYEYGNSFRGMYGMKLYYEAEGRLYHLVRHPRYLDMIGFMNTMYREGLMNKAWVVSNTELFDENVKAGRVFATACAYWDLDELNRYLQANYGEDAIMLGYKVLGEGIGETETTYGGRNSMGWDAIAITNHCEDVESAVKLADFLASEEGQYLMQWGIEGKHWNMEDGVHKPVPEVLEMLKEGTIREKTAIRRWTWFVKNGFGSDGTPYYMEDRYLPGREAQVSNRNMKYDYWDMAPYSDLMPERDSLEALHWKNIEDILERAYPKMVNAPNREEMEKIYRNTLDDMEDAGLAEVEEVITVRYRNRMIQWGKEEAE